MELVTDLFFTASLTLLLSFLVAKLVSFGLCHRDPPTATINADHEPVTLHEQFTVQSAQSETNVEFCSPIQVSTNVEIEQHADVVEWPVKSDIATQQVSNVDVLNEETREFGHQAIDDSEKQRKKECTEEISIESSTEMGISAKPVVKEVALEFVDDDDDDWEGIERSELEKVFVAATEFVVGNTSVVGSDVQMELYVLHKVATVGPCREPQPMLLKLSARANWNAWQKLGNMSPEVAMEQYITHLSDKVPGWMKDSSAGKSEQEPTRLEVFDSAAPDLSTSLSHHQTIETEREIERQSGAQDCSLLT